MSVEDYIASGKLEAYVLGELTQEESAEVEAMAANHPRVKEELQSIEETIQAMALRTAVAPPAGLKQRVTEAMSSSPTKTKPVEQSAPLDTPTGFRKYQLAAMLTIILISSVAALIFWNKWQAAENRIDDLIAQNQVLADQYDQASHQLDEFSGNVDILISEEYKKVVMRASESTSDAAASVFWSEQDRKVFLNVLNLPEPPDDKQYQLWALVDGQPIDAGVFDLPRTPGALLQMTSMEAADAFAITLEPKGGSASPTLEELMVIGNV